MKASDKTSQHLDFIKKFQTMSQLQGWRVVVYGGYGLDLALGRLTRPHGDIDLVIYGTHTRQHAKKVLEKYLRDMVITQLKFSENDFQLVCDAKKSDLVLNLYYVQTAVNPHLNLHQVIKKSGEVAHNDPALFPLPKEGRLGDLTIEVQDQQAHKKEIIAKGVTLSQKHQQDLEVISTLLSP